MATVFKGETLRDLFLNAYAFGTVGMIAGIAAVVAFVGAGIMLVLFLLLGLRHSRRVSPTQEILNNDGNGNGKTVVNQLEPVAV